jgi:hypothetical protein
MLNTDPRPIILSPKCAKRYCSNKTDNNGDGYTNAAFGSAISGVAPAPVVCAGVDIAAPMSDVLVRVTFGVPNLSGK